MNLYSNHRLPKPQLDVKNYVEMVLNSKEFETWFIRGRFAESSMKNVNYVMFEQMFRGQQLRYNWKLVKKPWYKVLSKKVGYVVGDSIYNYESDFAKMNVAERARFFTHECMHLMGFKHPDPKVPAKFKTICEQVSEYVEKAVAHYAKSNE